MTRAGSRHDINEVGRHHGHNQVRITFHDIESLNIVFISLFISHLWKRPSFLEGFYSDSLFEMCLCVLLFRFATFCGQIVLVYHVKYLFD